MRGILILMEVIIWVWLFPLSAVPQGQYDFELSEIKKKAYSVGGFLEFAPILFVLDRDAVLEIYVRAIEEYEIPLLSIEDGFSEDDYVAGGCCSNDWVTKSSSSATTWSPPTIRPSRLLPPRG